MKTRLGLLALAACVGALWALRPSARWVQVQCVDVGAGQSWIVNVRGGGSVVVNCGRCEDPGRAAVATEGALARSGRNSIACLIATRTDSDGCSAAGELAERLRIGKAIVAARGLAAARRSAPNLVWQSARPGGSIVTADGLTLTLLGAGGDVEAIVVECPPTSIALIDRLSPATVRQLVAAAPSAIVLGYSASRGEASGLGDLRADAAVLHSGTSRTEWADYGMLKTLQDRCERVWQTRKNGGIVLRADGRVIKATVTRPDE